MFQLSRSHIFQEDFTEFSRLNSLFKFFLYFQHSSWLIITVILSVKVKVLSQVRLFMTPWAVACQASLSMEWNSPGNNTGVVCHFLLQGTSRPRIKSRSPVLQADSLLSEPPGKPNLSVFLPKWQTHEAMQYTGFIIALKRF